jgi:hypothetical protein
MNGIHHAGPAAQQGGRWRRFWQRELTSVVPVLAATAANLLALRLGLGEVSGRLLLAALLATLAGATFSVALSRRSRLREIRRERQELLERTDRLLAIARARMHGQGNPRSEAAIDAELARLRHRDMMRYGRLLEA